MAAPLFCWILVSLSFLFSSADQKNVTAKPGDNVSLSCSAPEQESIVAVDWNRRDLGNKNVLSYKDDRIDPFNQHPLYKNRVDLQDRQMRNGNVSLVLKNVTINDTGSYECRVQTEGSLEIKLVSTSNMNVVPPTPPPLPPISTQPSPGGKDGGSEDGSNGLIVGLILSVAVLAAAAVLFLMYRKQYACFSRKSPDPPVDL